MMDLWKMLNQYAEYRFVTDAVERDRIEKRLVEIIDEVNFTGEITEEIEMELEELRRMWESSGGGPFPVEIIEK